MCTFLVLCNKFGGEINVVDNVCGERIKCDAARFYIVCCLQLFAKCICFDVCLVYRRLYAEFERKKTKYVKDKDS